MLRGLFRRTEPAAQLLPQPVPQTMGPKARPYLVSQSAVANCGPELRTPTAARKRRKRIPVEGLYRQPEPEPLVHARALLQLVQRECPQLIGKHVPQTDLARMYPENCKLEGWGQRHSTAIARQLGKIADKRIVKRDGRRFTVYRIPKH